MLAPWQQPVAGRTDGAGAATITVQGPAGHWSALYLPIEVASGSPVWTIRDGTTGNLPLIYGSGTKTMLGPFILQPGQWLRIVLTGADSNVLVEGQFLGWIADQPSELPAALPSPAAVSISGGQVNANIISGSVSISGTPTVQFAAGQSVSITAGTVNIGNNVPVINAGGTTLTTKTPITVLGSVTASAGTSNNASFTLDVGCVAIGYILDHSGGNAGPSLAAISGVQTLDTYLQDSFPPDGVHAAIIAQGVDTSVKLTVTAPGGSPSKVWLLEFFAPNVNILSPNIERPVIVTNYDSTGTGIIATAAPWQAPQGGGGNVISIGSALAANGTVTLVSAITGFSIYVHQIFLGLNVAGAVTIQDSNGSRFHLASGTAVFPVYDCKGRESTSGVSMVIKEQSGVAQTFNLNMGFNQLPPS